MKNLPVIICFRCKSIIDKWPKDQDISFENTNKIEVEFCKKCTDLNFHLGGQSALHEVIQVLAERVSCFEECKNCKKDAFDLDFARGVMESISAIASYLATREGSRSEYELLG